MGEPDGQAAWVEAEALGRGAAMAAEVGRRPLARDLVDAALGQKLLQGWIENRAQTMHPLTLNLGQMGAARAGLLLRAVGAAMTAAGATSPARTARAQAWLARAKGTAEQGAMLAAAVEAGQGLHELIEPIREQDLAGHVFAATLAATDQRDAVNRAYADYLGRRLGIPAAMRRSLARRYRN